MAQVLQHLYRFVRTEAHLDWSSKEREAFEEAKVAVNTDPRLRHSCTGAAT